MEVPVQRRHTSGPGRPPGRKNNKTLALEEAARKAGAEIDGIFEGDAHAFLQAVYRNPNVPLEIRIMAAGKALRVEKPILAATQSRVNVNFDFGSRLEAARRRLELDSLQQADQALQIEHSASEVPAESEAAEPILVSKLR